MTEIVTETFKSHVVLSVLGRAALALAREYLCAYDVLRWGGYLAGPLLVRKRFAYRPLLQRLVALTAAYAIALSSLIVSFGVTRAAIAIPGTISCHSDAGGATPPAGSGPDSKLCDASCCTGCLMLVAALPPPPDQVAEAPRSVGAPLPLVVITTVSATAHTSSHRSRAPPRTA